MSVNRQKVRHGCRTNEQSCCAQSHGPHDPGTVSDAPRACTIILLILPILAADEHQGIVALLLCCSWFGMKPHGSCNYTCYVVAYAVGMNGGLVGRMTGIRS